MDDSEYRARQQAFIADIIAVLQKHNATIDQDEEWEGGGEDADSFCVTGPHYFRLKDCGRVGIDEIEAAIEKQR